MQAIELLGPVVPASKDGLTWYNLPLDQTSGASEGKSLRLAIVQHRTGPTALLIGRMHGDEVEGEIALRDLLRSLEIADLAGRLIVVPRANPGAAQTGTRVASDEVDLNRCMPGRIGGTVTERLAHLIAKVLLPEADLVVDLHSGGRHYISAEIAWIAAGGNAEEQRRAWTAAQAFGAPFALVAEGPGAGTLAEAAAGKLYIGTDTPGAGIGSPAAIRRMRDGVLRLLMHEGLLKGSAMPSPPSRFVRVAPGWGALIAPRSGLLEPIADVGEELAEGQIVARLHPGDLSAAPSEVLCPSPAIMLGRCPAGLMNKGQRIAVLGLDEPFPSPSSAARSDLRFPK